MAIKTLIIMVCIFLSFTLVAEGQQNGTFDINSQTLIVDTEGNYIDFNTFIGLNPGTDYSDLSPEFDKDGKLKLIKITLKRKLQPKKVAKTVPVTKTSSIPTSSSPVKTKPVYSSPTPVRTSPSPSKSKFRFTTASELKGLQAPYYHEKDINGREFSSSSMFGKIVVVKFWFLKCAPCLEEIPELNTLARKYQNNPNVQFIAPATDEYDAVKRFMNKRPNFQYKILPNALNIHSDFKVAGYPTHIVIYKNGIVGKVLTGKNSRLVDVLETAIEEGLLLDADDKSITEISQPLYKSGMYIVAEEGYALSKEEYLNKVATGNYKIYKKIKMNGSEQIYMKKISL